MILHQNDILTLKDLALLFHVTYDSIRQKKMKERKLKQLKELCKYHFEGKRIVIDEVFYSTYDQYKGDKIRVLRYFIDRFSTDDEMYPHELNSYSGMAKELQDIYPEIYGLLSEQTVIRRIKPVAEYYFGQTLMCHSLPSFDDKGEIGYKEYVWAIKNYDCENSYRYLTEDEDKLFLELSSKYYDKEHIEFKERNIHETALLIYAIEKNEDDWLNKITGAQLIQMLNKNYNQKRFFLEVIQKFKAAKGEQLVRATRYQIELSMGLEKIKKDYEELTNEGK